MPEAVARLRYLRTSPYKVREVLELIRGLDVDEARTALRLCRRGPSHEVLKVLESAVANADHNLHLPEEELFVARAYADEGMTLKRWRPRARGRATRIRKRTSHVTIVLDRLPERELARRRARAGEEGRRARRQRVERSRRREQAAATEQEPAVTGHDAAAEDIPAAEPDTAPSDTGPNDTASNDAGPSDTAPSDTGPSDAGPSDAGPKEEGEK